MVVQEEEAEQAVGDARPAVAEVVVEDDHAAVGQGAADEQQVMAGGAGAVAAVDAGEAHGREAVGGEEGRGEGVGCGLEEVHRRRVDAEVFEVVQKALSVPVAGSVGVEFLEVEDVDGPEGVCRGGSGGEGEEELAVVDTDFADAAPHSSVYL